MVKLEEPDKGQAWVVAIAACIINMILSGLSRMIGLLYVAVLNEYGVSRQEATLPFTVRNSIRCLAGPIVGVVGQRYGIRAVTFCGGVVAVIGAGLCCIAPSVAWLAFFWGGIHGLGFAFANTLFQVVVNQYFLKYRATASGIALSGACIGSFVFPFLIEIILSNFGVSGGFLIIAGIVMHVLPPSLVLKAPPWVEYPEQYARLKAKLQQQSTETLDSDVPENPAEEDAVEELHSYVRSTSLSNCPVEELEVCSCSRSLRGSTENLDEKFQNVIRASRRDKSKKSVVCTLYLISESPPINRRYSKKIENSISSREEKDSAATISGDVVMQNSLDLPRERTSPTKEQTSLWDSIKGIVVLYKNPVYVLISICMSTYIIIFIPLLTVIVDYSMDKGIPESAGKYLINAMAFGDLIGRLCFGWVTDRSILTIPVFMTLSLVLEGIVISMFPFAQSLYSLSLLIILYGITAGTILVHFPLLVLKYVDLKLQSVAMGCVGFLSGIVSFGIPPLIGHFRDNVGSYDGMFYLTGVISIVSGGLWLLEPLVARIHRKNEQKRAMAKSKKAEAFNKSVLSSNQLKDSR